MLIEEAAQRNRWRGVCPQAKALFAAAGLIAAYLAARGLRSLYLCGLATDFCVAWSALDARAAGFEVTVIEDACRAIDLNGSLAQAWADMAAAGVRRIDSAQI